MSKLNDKQINLIRLIARSPDIGESWRLVSDTLRNFVTDLAGEQPELYEIKEQDDALMIRLSERGSVLEAYL